MESNTTTRRSYHIFLYITLDPNLDELATPAHSQKKACTHGRNIQSGRSHSTDPSSSQIPRVDTPILIPKPHQTIRGSPSP